MVLQAKRIFSLIFLAVGVLHAEFRTFTNDLGDSIEAELLELKQDGSVVAMRMQDGRELDAPLSVFSQADRKYIHTWWEGMVAAEQVLRSDVRLNLNVKMNRKSKKTGYSSWYADRKIKSFFPEVVIDNLATQTFTGNQVRLVIFAEDKSDKDQILVVSANDLKTDLAGRANVTFEGDPFRIRHYEYKNSYSNYEYGYEYIGYALTIKNSAGEVTHEKASVSKFLNPNLFFKCKAGEMYDAKFERKLNSYPSSYYLSQ